MEGKMRERKKQEKSKNWRKEEKKEKMQGRAECKIDYGWLFDIKNPVIILESPI